MTDNEILCLMREAPPNGQRALFDKYYNYVYSIVNRIISGFGSPDDSDECVIDVFASLMMKMTPDENMTSLKSYIGAVARNTAIGMRRSLASKTGRNISADDEEMAEIVGDENIEESADKSELSKILLDKIGEIGPPDSIIIIEKYYYDKSSKEIAEKLGMNAAAVRVRCGRAMKRLKKLLDDTGITL
ncbi:MAG: sigma-70 family RNA polymerase sigma factor [Ruminococcus sp.]|uniref:RNA polymerase sigma factor n=1 Tax=Ruminococcus sp. TaxID=41978 RepID=UPI0025E70E9E|nr:sigma-70 family RNA polymerase sigma factor [Ruminococcus sp.]MCR5600978.1 sigma-70 family RNA polymerase sigma factor [Ruminococcus sp.]